MEERNLLVRKARGAAAETSSGLFANLSALELEDNILEGGFGSRRDFLRYVQYVALPQEFHYSAGVPLSHTVISTKETKMYVVVSLKGQFNEILLKSGFFTTHLLLLPLEMS